MALMRQAQPAQVSSINHDGDFYSQPSGLNLTRCSLDTIFCRCGCDRSKAASTLAEVLSGIQEGRSGYKGEALKQAVKEACGWGGAGEDGPLLDIVRSRVEVQQTWCRRRCTADSVPLPLCPLKSRYILPSVHVGGTLYGGRLLHTSRVLHESLLTYMLKFLNIATNL